MMSFDQAVAALPRALSSYPIAAASRLVGCWSSESRSSRSTRSPPRSSSWRSSTRSRRAVRRGWPTRCSTPRAGARRPSGRRRRASPPKLLHFLGEIEVVFGLWAIVLLVAMIGYAGWDAATHYFNDGVNYTEPLFVVVIMALAARRGRSSRSPKSALRRVAELGGGTPAAWWLTILTVGPLLGSFITEPARDDDLRAAAGAAVLRPEPSTAAEVRDARPAVRERLDRRHADAFRRAAGADGRAALGVGHAVHARPFRLARGARDRRRPR